MFKIKSIICVFIVSLLCCTVGCNLPESWSEAEKTTEELIAELGVPVYDLDPADVAEDPMYYELFAEMTDRNFVELTDIGIAVAVLNENQRVFILNTKFHDLPNYNLWEIMDDMFYDTGFDFGYCKSYEYNGWIVDCYSNTIIVTRESWEGDYLVWFVRQLTDGILNQ